MKYFTDQHAFQRMCYVCQWIIKVLRSTNRSKEAKKAQIDIDKLNHVDIPIGIKLFDLTLPLKKTVDNKDIFRELWILST